LFQRSANPFAGRIKPNQKGKIMADSDSVLSVLRRKVAAARTVDTEGGPGADRSWRVSLARAARDAVKLPLDVQYMALARMSLTEMLEVVPERSLIAMLQGHAGALGVLVLSPEVLTSMVEMQTIGRVNKGPAPNRKPTRTDAAMAQGMIDAALTGLETSLAEEADLVWAGGYRYGSHLEDARPLGLLLDDVEYRTLTAQVSLSLGQRLGSVFLALPAAGWAAHTDEAEGVVGEVSPHHLFSEELAERVEGASCMLLATLTRLSLPLGDIMALSEGMVLPLRQASVDRVRLEGMDGRILGEGRLGQNRGMRAVRLAAKAETSGRPVRTASVAPAVAAAVPAVPQGAAEPLRATG
jgi:flagellar motor switch protein FliM